MVCGWVQKSFKFPKLKAFLEEEDEGYFEEISTNFVYGGASSDGAFKGCIGALDGLVVKITKRLTLSRSLRDPGAYYCQKGFHALNVLQGICDHRKKTTMGFIKAPYWKLP